MLAVERRLWADLGVWLPNIHATTVSRIVSLAVKIDVFM